MLELVVSVREFDLRRGRRRLNRTAFIGPLLDIPMEHVGEVYGTNVVAVIRVCKAVAPHMIERKSGLIVNVSSIAGTLCVNIFL